MILKESHDWHVINPLNSPSNVIILMKYLSGYSLIFLIILSGCSLINQANRKLKRAEKLINQAEQLGVKWHSDTVLQKIPVYIDSVVVDSIFTSIVGDTVYMERERLKVKYVRLKGDSIFIRGECLADTVKIQVPVTVTKEIKTGLSALVVVQWSILALLVGAVLSRIFWK